MGRAVVHTQAEQSVSASSGDRLRLEGVSRLFGDKAAVRDLSLSVAPGEVVCLLGPSGCGKSTTLRIAAGVERQSGGRVLVDGVSVSDDARHAPPEARAIGLMFQDFALFPHLTVAKNVAFGLRGMDKEAALARASAELGRVGLAGYEASYPHELSGGEQQRVALARALAPKPSVMLMDEPFSSLDHRLRDAVRDEALALMKEAGTAVLLVTHDPDEAMRMGDRIALMRDGGIVQIGAPYHVYNHPVDRRSAAFFSDVNIIHGVVNAQQTDTPFGRFLTPGLVDDVDVEVIIRPQHLKIDMVSEGRPEDSPSNGVAAAGVVERARFMGAHSLIEVRMAPEESVLTATVPGAFLPPAGAPVWLSLRRDRCFVFPCAVQSVVEFPYFNREGGLQGGLGYALDADGDVRPTPIEASEADAKTPAMWS
ncbi:MAG: ABC transporter ATP-binding protein [Rhodobacteraceae bacterium]|nr:ABC transporter ATP-binding protein [Paracoccaceae bacterium]